MHRELVGDRNHGQKESGQVGEWLTGVWVYWLGRGHRLRTLGQDRVGGGTKESIGHLWNESDTETDKEQGEKCTEGVVPI